MGTKIQINSLQALERLIGGDSEIEIEIRNSVVQEFGKKYLKTLAQNFSFKDQRIINELIQKEVQKCIGIEYYWNGSIKLSQKILGDIEFAVEKHIKDRIAKASSDFANNYNIERMVETRVNAILTTEIERLVRTKVKNLIDKIKD